MKELKIHKNTGGNLCSIASLDDNYSDRLYLSTLISNVFNMANGLLHVKVSRPNYSLDNILEKLKALDLVKGSLLVEAHNFELSFLYNKKIIDCELTWFLSNIWFAFEQASYTFLVNENSEPLQSRTSWVQITVEAPAYVMFKGAEENVVWIGKSLELDLVSFPI